jgi:hypothetical protein
VIEVKEYIGNCPNCHCHTLVESSRSIKPNSQRKPQRVAKCSRCGQTKRITILGEFVREKRKVEIPNPEDPKAELLKSEKVVTIMRLWRRPQTPQSKRL